MLKTINAYVGTFEKKTGEERSMRFVKISDLPEGFMDSQTKGGQQRKLSEGNELVWDLDKKQFRVFNWNTVKGDVTQITNFRVDSLI
tara:strand:+ start:134 stop:394 length:261 start_codon:yes stop_codon:yes gene_type:complete